ncbi:MAG: hypothetical protein UIM53_01085 [Acutalibacteraceae bacterium]|nr:hypothetical protein [Acutalibacteraceae bacterium]
MEDEILEKILRECNFIEGIVVRIFKKLFINTYHIGRITCWNSKK